MTLRLYLVGHPDQLMVPEAFPWKGFNDSEECSN